MLHIKSESHIEKVEANGRPTDGLVHDRRGKVPIGRLEAVGKAVSPNSYITPLVEKLFIDNKDSIKKTLERLGMEDFSRRLIETFGR